MFFISGHPWLHGEDIPYCLEKWWVKGSADACCKNGAWNMTLLLPLSISHSSPHLLPSLLWIKSPSKWCEVCFALRSFRQRSRSKRETEIKKERQGGSYPDKWLINKTLEAKTNDPDPLWSITPDIFNIWLNTTVTFYLTSDHSISNTTQGSCLKWKLSRAHCCI